MMPLLLRTVNGAQSVRSVTRGMVRMFSKARSKNRILFSGVGYLALRNVGRRGQQVIRVQSGIDGAQSDAAPKQQARADQKHDGERHTRNDQQLTDASVALRRAPAARPALQRFVGVAPGELPGGHEGSEESRRRRNRRREAEDTAVECGLQGDFFRAPVRAREHHVGLRALHVDAGFELCDPCKLWSRRRELNSRPADYELSREPSEGTQEDLTSSAINDLGDP